MEKETISLTSLTEESDEKQRKTVFGFDPRISKESQQYIIEKYGLYETINMGITTDQERRFSLKKDRGTGRRFMGQGRQVHKVSADGRVLDEVVPPAPPSFRERLVNILSSSDDHFFDAFRREAFGWLCDNKHAFGDRLIRWGNWLVQDR